MARVRVSYGRCKRVTFNNKKNQHKLIEGRLYYITDTGEILRANSTNTYEKYSNRVFLVDDFPTGELGDEWVPENIYIKKGTGRGKIATNDGVIIELRCDGGGGGGGGGDISDLEADVETIKTQLRWKQLT